jgi:hypothetical protein
LPQRSWKKSNANAAGAKTCRIFSAYFQLIVVYCIYKLKKAEGYLPVNILIVADEPPARPCRGMPPPCIGWR